MAALTDNNMIKQEKIDQLLSRFDAVESELSSGPEPSKLIALSKEHSDLMPVVEMLRNIVNVRQEIIDLKEILNDKDSDAEMIEMAKEEASELEKNIPTLEHDLQILLLPKDMADEKNAILEVRAGTGGDEAALFAGDLFRMYKRYSDLNGWKLQIISQSASERGGFKEISATIAGKGVFAKMKYESGVHRVQRVPSTESGGRVHTSAATVAVLPEAEEVDVKIEDKDLRIDVFRASGPGGQSVNTTDSAVRITHIPTGIVVSQQDEKSQHKNRAKGMMVLRSRIYEAERQRLHDIRAGDRKEQVGSGDRSERIRTYNFPQGRVSDHRINLTLYKLDKLIAGDGLHEMINALINDDQARKLSALQNEI